MTNNDDWQDEWEVMGNAELEVMACMEEWDEVLCRVWKLEREISGRKVARMMARPCPHGPPAYTYMRGGSNGDRLGQSPSGGLAAGVWRGGIKIISLGTKKALACRRELD